jgi:hypothetical protein
LYHQYQISHIKEKNNHHFLYKIAITSSFCFSVIHSKVFQNSPRLKTFFNHTIHQMVFKVNITESAQDFITSKAKVQDGMIHLDINQIEKKPDVVNTS